MMQSHVTLFTTKIFAPDEFFVDDKFSEAGGADSSEYQVIHVTQLVFTKKGKTRKTHRA